MSIIDLNNKFREIKTVSEEVYFGEICNTLNKLCPHMLDCVKDRLPRVIWRAIKNSGFLEPSNYQDFPCRNWVHICSGCIDVSPSVSEVYLILKWRIPENATFEYIKKCEMLTYYEELFDERFYESILKSEDRWDVFPDDILNDDESGKTIESFKEFLKGDLIKRIKGELNIPVSEKIDIFENIIKKYPRCSRNIDLCMDSDFGGMLREEGKIDTYWVAHIVDHEIDTYISSLLKNDDVAFMFSKKMDKCNVRRSSAKSARK